MATILATTMESVEATSPAEAAPSVSWQASLKAAIRSGHELCQQLAIEPSRLSSQAEADFPVVVPAEYLAKMRPGDPSDPLLRQVLASPSEESGEGLIDPVGDSAAQRGLGLLQKYAHRVLLVTTGACAVHCRYCFRRHYPYNDLEPGRRGLQASLDEIAADPSLHEVILSGGDPLTLSDTLLSWLVDQVNQIPHVQRLRIHTRLPVVIPQRVCDALLTWVRAARPAVYFVMHFNHAREIDARTNQALSELRRAGASLLNQAVLLRGVNDSLEAQLALCQTLVDQQVIPYYLHQLDPVQGAMHFETPESQGKEIVRQLRENLPGYAVPQFVREIAGEPNKTPL